MSQNTTHNPDHWVDPKNFTHERDERWTAVDDYNNAHLHAAGASPAPELMRRILASSAAAGMPSIWVAPAHGKFLQLQARLMRARSIVEVGMLGGYSTVWLATSHPDARVTSIEISPEFAAQARTHFGWAGVSERVDVKVGSGMDVLPELVEEFKAGKRPAVDFAFIDANKENNLDYFNFVVEFARPGACIVVDNVVRRGGLVDPTRADELAVIGTKRLIEAVGKDPRVDATILQTVGDKNYDGFLTAIVKGDGY